MTKERNEIQAIKEKYDKEVDELKKDNQVLAAEKDKLKEAQIKLDALTQEQTENHDFMQKQMEMLNVH